MLVAWVLVAVLAGPQPADAPDLPGGEAAPGAALRLAPDPAASPVSGGPVPAGGAGPPSGLSPTAVLAAVALLAGRVLDRRRRERAAGAPPPVHVVFVPGHGSPAEGTFSALIDRLGLQPEQIHRFDYRWAAGGGDHAAAAEAATIDDTVDALEGFLGGLAGDGRPLYLVGFSKGGAALAELVARWDADPSRPVPFVVGVALLDPPIATGVLGDLQSIGAMVGPIPDDGGFDPVSCRFLGVLDCHDRREHLGRAAGIPVVVIRNPDALVTNFRDEPAGLRVFDLHDDGGGVWGWWHRGGFLGRITAAHTGVVGHPATATCLGDEMWLPGSCRWDAGPVAAGPGPRPWWRRVTDWLWSPGGLIPDSWNPRRHPRPSAWSLLDKIPFVRSAGAVLRRLGL